MPAPAIEARGLVKRYGETVAVGGVSFEVPSGTVTAVLGPNGAGKTTTVRMLTTLTVPDEGSATVAGYDVAKSPTEVRRRIGLAAQDATVDPLLTGRENLVMLGELHQISRKAAGGRAVELLAEFDLTDAGDRPVSTYSGGMRRRLDLAATLVALPTVLFLDEPTTGLDPRARNELWAVLDTLVHRGTTVLLTTQYLEEAERLAADIVVVDHGRIIAHGDSAKLKRDVGGDHLHVAIREEAELARGIAIVESITKTSAHVEHADRLVSAPTTAGVSAVAAAASAFQAAGIELDDLSLRQPTLDEVFLTLTGSPPDDSDPSQLTEEGVA